MNSTATQAVPRPVESNADVLTPRIRLQCPHCERALDASGQTCDQCGFKIAQTDGIYRALPLDRQEHFRQFVIDYQTVRDREGRGSTSKEYYLALPFEDRTGRNTWQWTIRARTFAHFEKSCLAAIAREYPQGADILDIGAGNGWLSYRLALKGHRPVALDLLDNATDGLGAVHHYSSHLKSAHLSDAFPCFQAEMDRLPFASKQFDAVIFNASFHYSVDYETTVMEALRCLRDSGYIVIADSPWYRRSESGERMVKEKRQAFSRMFGFSSDSIASREYLSPEALSCLSRRFALQWHVERPWYGVSWALRPLKAWALRKREPSKFYLLWARVAR